MTNNPTYYDSLITITAGKIIFADYYFPWHTPKTVRLVDISCITVCEPTIWNGKWRLHGTGNIKTWFPADYSRPRRDKIFLADLKNQWINIGFTVEDSTRVEAIFRQLNLIRD
jgi:hypothetical protein